MAHVAEHKKKVVAEFIELLDSYPVVGVVNMSNLPAKQVQSMRSKLRDKKTVLKMTKKRLLKIALSKSNKANVADLQNYMSGMPAVVFTNENPFKLYAELQKTKSRAPAKAGQIAPNDISVKAGPTSFAPGPVIGQLGKFGIKTGIEGGKIVIKQDSVVAKKGQVIDAELAGILTRLGIEPMEIGLDLTGVYEEGVIYTGDVLYIDEKEYARNIQAAYSQSLNLAVHVAYPTEDTINILLGKAYTDSKALAVSQGIINEETAPEIIKKAYFEMLSLSNSLPEEALSEELKAGKAAKPVDKAEDKPKPEEPKKEEKQEDAAAGLGSLFG
jgi:large subunit ribosomal protein L10